MWVNFTNIMLIGKSWHKNLHIGVPIVAQWVKNPTSIHEDAGSIPCLAQWIKDLALLQADLDVRRQI